MPYPLEVVLQWHDFNNWFLVLLHNVNICGENTPANVCGENDGAETAPMKAHE